MPLELRFESDECHSNGAGQGRAHTGIEWRSTAVPDRQSRNPLPLGRRKIEAQRNSERTEWNHPWISGQSGS